MSYNQANRPAGQNFSLNIDQDPNKGRKPDYWGFNELVCPHCSERIRWRFSLWWRQVKQSGKHFLGGEASVQADKPDYIRPSNPPQHDPHGRHLNQGFTAGPPQPPSAPPPPPHHGTAGEHAMGQEHAPVYNPEAVDEYGRPYYPPQQASVPRYQGDD